MMMFSLGSSAPTYDVDAQAFLTATGIPNDGTIFFTGTPQEITGQNLSNAINQLVLDLKSYSLWSKMKAIYPIVGGTAFTHKFNLKDPRDLNVAGRLTYSGIQIHSSNGMTSNNYVNTHFIPSSNLSLNSAHLSFYSRTNNSGQNVEIGVSSASASLFIAPNFSGSSFRAVNSNQTSAGAGQNMKAFFIASRITSTVAKLYRNNSIAFNDTLNSGSLSNGNITLFGYNAFNYISNQQCAFASIGDGLSDTEASNFYTCVQTFQTALGRNI
jgi:hypothetical protein